VGGIQLTLYSEEQAEFFEEGKEIFFFRDKDEVASQAAKILDMPDQEIADVRKNARKRSTESGYTFKDRANTVFNTFSKYL
jgi:spore maturation protein CgeB